MIRRSPNKRASSVTLTRSPSQCPGWTLSSIADEPKPSGRGLVGTTQKHKPRAEIQLPGHQKASETPLPPRSSSLGPRPSSWRSPLDTTRRTRPLTVPFLVLMSPFKVRPGSASADPHRPIHSPWPGSSASGPRSPLFGIASLPVAWGFLVSAAIRLHVPAVPAMQREKQLNAARAPRANGRATCSAGVPRGPRTRALPLLIACSGCIPRAGPCLPPAA